jgi:hypothetical protein
MSLVLAILAGWFLLSLAVALLFGRAARLGGDQPRLAGGSADPAYTVAVVPAPADASSRRRSGPAAA